MTLVEVLAGLVVLGTVLSAILTIRARYTRQFVLAEQKLAAVELTDALIEQWMLEERVPTAQSGMLGETLAWRTSLVPNREAEELESRVVRVEVFDAERKRTLRDDDALLTIDLVVPGVRPSDLLSPDDVDPQGQREAGIDPASGEATTQPATQPTVPLDQLYVDPRLMEGPSR